MFDGVVDIGVDYVNGKGKQRSVSNFFNALVFKAQTDSEPLECTVELTLI